MVATLHLLSFLPDFVHYPLGAQGRFIGYVLDRRHVRIGLKNVELAFARLSDKERRQIAQLPEPGSATLPTSDESFTTLRTANNLEVLRGFNITQLGHAPDKIGKDTNFRGLTIFNNVIYTTKGSGSNGVNTVYLSFCLFHRQHRNHLHIQQWSRPPVRQ